MEGKKVKVISNGMVDVNRSSVDFDCQAECGINERVRFDVLKEILEQTCRARRRCSEAHPRAIVDELIPKHMSSWTTFLPPSTI